MRHWRGPFPPPVKDTESKIIEDRQIDIWSFWLCPCSCWCDGLAVVPTNVP
ncbi:hypothetical protein PRUPE_6G342900 [Prunus persica]|uniref:Uncharacterized protein n=1 Tax=Prunus persica TaxID=3760 RepID=A0A251NZX1_PRUPE|nr:hypothetical protein PRUPE_6G342900 [Prunus persica]